MGMAGIDWGGNGRTRRNLGHASGNRGPEPQLQLIPSLFHILEQANQRTDS